MRLPREGMEGGGRMLVANSKLLGAMMEKVSDMPEELDYYDSARLEAEETSEFLAGTMDTALNSTGNAWQVSSKASLKTIKTSPSTSQMAKEARRSKSCAELSSRMDRLEQDRFKDQQEIQIKVGHRRNLREQRFHRMFQDVMGHNSDRHEAAMMLREWEENNENVRRGMYNAWDAAVQEPVAKQMLDHVTNSRATQQQRTGKKNVEIRLPGQGTKAFVRNSQDPLKKQLREQAAEELVLQELEEVVDGPKRGIQRHLSAPSFAPAAAGGAIAARSRPVLEPTEWVPPRLQGVPACGRLAQQAEEGPGFTRIRRGGYNAHVPDESDGVSAAGKRLQRTSGRVQVRNSVGLLRGDLATRGEASLTKSLLGASHAAPLQDHFTFPLGKEVCDKEFPLGKKVDYPRM